MNREIQQFFELLSRRLASLRLLAADLESAREALVNMDLNGIHEHNTYQENACKEIGFLNHQLEAHWRKLSGEAQSGDEGSGDGTLTQRLKPEEKERLGSLLSEMDIAQKKVRGLNRVQTGLLRRSRRSVNVLMNFMANYSATYEPPRYRSASA